MNKMSRRKYYMQFILVLLATGVLISIGAPVVNKYFYGIRLVDIICISLMLGIIVTVIMLYLIIVIKYKGLIPFIRKLKLLSTIEENMISIGAYEKKENKNYLIISRIRISNDHIKIKLNNVKLRSVIERYLDSFSTALPKRYVVQDYYISKDNSAVVIEYEDIKNYKPERYSLNEYKNIFQDLSLLELYFDKKHIVNINDHPHFLISGSSGSGKSYLVNELVVQAIIKGWEVTVLDLKRSYGLFKAHIDYVYEMDDILSKLKFIEQEMTDRMENLQEELDKNPRVQAVDIGYKVKLVILEEYISLQASLDKKSKEELERIVKNISVLARQSNIVLMIVLQSAGTENIQSTTRSNLTKVLMGNAQSNILTATFGNNVDIPSVTTKLEKGEGLIQLDRITMLRVPEIHDIDDFNNMIV